MSADTVGASLAALATCWECTKATIRIVGESKPLQLHPSYFYLNQFLLRGLLDATIIGIRRQIDTVQGTVSLVHFLDELKRNADVYTLQDCIDAHLERGRRMNFQRAELQRYEDRAKSVYGLVAESPTRLSTKHIGGVKKALSALSSTIEVAANKYVAHQDRQAPEIDIPLHQIDDVMKVLYGIANMYLPIFTGGNSDAFGHIDTTTWESMFTFPWKEQT